jgi:hypothetical protein
VEAVLPAVEAVLPVVAGAVVVSEVEGVVDAAVVPVVVVPVSDPPLQPITNAPSAPATINIMIFFICNLLFVGECRVHRQIAGKAYH